MEVRHLVQKLLHNGQFVVTSISILTKKGNWFKILLHAVNVSFVCNYDNGFVG
jgi:hypothetical protein